MEYPEDQVRPIIEEMCKKIKSPRTIEEINYRADWGDYQILFDENFHVEIREKLMEMFIESKHSEARKEMEFKLKHPSQFEDWE